MVTVQSFWIYGLYGLACYLTGAIPTAYWLVKRLTGQDIRQCGSGNVGATNVKRVVGSGPARVVLAIDFLKGLLPLLLARWMFSASTDLAGSLPVAQIGHVVFASLLILGHSRSIFIGFKGGKGAITGLGTLCALVPMVSLVSGLVALSVFRVSRIVSISSIMGAITAACMVWLLKEPLPYAVYTVFASIFVIWLHRSNIERLLKGQESRLS
ncbi:MAG: glycerol-3-phosphate 1-O-acyltransferase PlsY [Vampirovibrionales bacterium]|nr:glycerol-3-phosphate 1-O-acyltransferase PlsY [Vampirovibrionales bacterium]